MELTADGLGLGRRAEVREPTALPIIEQAKPLRECNKTGILPQCLSTGARNEDRRNGSWIVEPDALFVRGGRSPPSGIKPVCQGIGRVEIADLGPRQHADDSFGIVVVSRGARTTDITCGLGFYRSGE
jgi:hypothetical protein